MRKKFIGVYALMAVLALGTTVTSCVDDNESASVAAIRDAKAEQLKALAAAANADAEYYKAMAAVQNANAEQIANQTAEEKAKFEIQLEQLKAEAEQARLYALQQIQNATQGMISQATTNYTNAAEAVVTLTGQIIDQELLIKKNEAGLISAQKLAEELILGYNRTIAKEEAKKAVYEAISADGNYDVVVEKQKLTSEQTDKANVVSVKTAEYNNANTAFTDAAAAWAGKTATDGTNTVTIEPTLKTGKAIQALVDMDNDGVISASVLVTDNKYADAEAQTGASVSVYSLNEAQVIRETVALKNAIATAEANLGETDDAAVGPTDPSASAATAYAKYNFYKEAYDNAKAAYDAAPATPADVKEGLKDAMDLANATLIEQKALILDPAQDAIDVAKENQKNFNDAIALLDAESAEYKEYIAAIDAVLAKEGKALNDAQKAKDDAVIAYDEVTAKLTAVNRFISQVALPGGGTQDVPVAGDVEALIIACDKAIAEANENIAMAEQMIASGGTEGAAAILEKSKQDLENMKVELELKKQIAEKYKAELEAAINAGAVETPSETPAE